MKWRMLNNNRGFTLIEMMIVLLVISVLLIITIPNVYEKNSCILKNKQVNRILKL